MKKRLLWIIGVIALIICIISLSILSYKVMDGNYNIETEAYIALIAGKRLRNYKLKE